MQTVASIVTLAANSPHLMCAGHAEPYFMYTGHAEPADTSFWYLQQVMATQSQPPPSYEQLSNQLPKLPYPLPILPQTFAVLDAIPHVSQQLPSFAISTSHQPARQLALPIAFAMELPVKGRGEHMVVVDTATSSSKSCARLWDCWASPVRLQEMWEIRLGQLWPPNVQT